MATIKKKAWPEWFEAVLSGKKKYDLRLNDFEVNPGDTLILEEWDPQKQAYTGRTVEKKVTYVGKAKMGEMFNWSKEEVESKGLQILSLE